MSDIRDHVCDACTTRAVVRCSSHLQVWYGCRTHTHLIFRERHTHLVSEQQHRDDERDKPLEAP